MLKSEDQSTSLIAMMKMDFIPKPPGQIGTVGSWSFILRPFQLSDIIELTLID